MFKTCFNMFIFTREGRRGNGVGLSPAWWLRLPVVVRGLNSCRVGQQSLPNWWQCSMVKTRSTMFGTWSTPFSDHVILTLFWPCSDHVQSWPCFMFGTWSTLVCHCSLTFLCWPCFDHVLNMFWPCSDHDHSWPCSMFGTLKSQTRKKYIN